MNCDLIAPHYWWIEKLGMGGALERRRRWFLPEFGNARRALVLGDGDGRFLKALLGRNPVVRADYVDLSKRMLELARRKSGADRVAYRKADARMAEFAPGEYDLIATHFFFDCFSAEELAALIGRIAPAAKPGAQWVVSEFCVATLPARLLVRFLYLFFRITTGLKTRRLADHRPFLQSHGFRLVNSNHARSGIVVSELWERVVQSRRLSESGPTAKRKHHSETQTQ
jgi:SAM-dependent methyltransferase